jgi:hypothetical protein
MFVDGRVSENGVSWLCFKLLRTRVILISGVFIYESIRKIMKKILSVLAISVFSLAAHAAGSPMNEDFTELLSISNKVLEAAKSSDGETVSQLAEQGMQVTKDQGMKGQSPGLQRVGERMKKAKKAGKKGDFAAATAAMNEAIAEMQKEKPKPNFGGGSEDTAYKFGTK